MPNTQGAVPLGGGSNGSPRFERLSERDRRDLEALAESTGTPAGQSVPTAFLVVVTEPGVAVAIQDLAALAKYSPQHPASIQEMLMACGYVRERIHDSMLIQGIVATSMQTAAAMQRQAADAQLATELGLN